MIRNILSNILLLALLAGNLAFTSCSDSMVEENCSVRSETVPFRYRRRSFIDQWYLRMMYSISVTSGE